MSRTSFHVDPQCEGKVIQAIEDAGLEWEVGGSPMVDFVVSEPEEQE